MRKYYYAVGGARVGPVTLGELKLVSGLTPETLVWYDGLSTWLRAGDISELSELFAYVPPVVGGVGYASAVLPSGVEQPMFSDFLSFEGRIRRLEYVISSVISPCVFVLCQWAWSDVNCYRLSFASIIYWLCMILVCWFNLAQGCKRSHDTGQSGWMQVIPFYSIYLLFAQGNKGANEYGPNPKGE